MRIPSKTVHVATPRQAEGFTEGFLVTLDVSFSAFQRQAVVQRQGADCSAVEECGVLLYRNPSSTARSNSSSVATALIALV